jgi:YD repeat-containing protein
LGPGARRRHDTANAGAARTWQYTYNTAGQLLSRTRPPDASGNAESARLTYYADTTDGHTTGDIASVANGAGVA